MTLCVQGQQGCVDILLYDSVWKKLRDLLVNNSVGNRKGPFLLYITLWTRRSYTIYNNSCILFVDDTSIFTSKFWLSLFVRIHILSFPWTFLYLFPVLWRMFFRRSNSPLITMTHFLLHFALLMAEPKVLWGQGGGLDRVETHFRTEEPVLFALLHKTLIEVDSGLQWALVSSSQSPEYPRFQQRC